MFGSENLKDYYIIYFDFELNKYFVYKYLKNRKLTAKQRWNVIFKNEYAATIIDEGKAFDIGNYEDIIKKLKLPQKRCEMNIHCKGL